MSYSNGKKIALMIVLVPILIVLFVTLVMYLWNWLVPTLFSGPIITFWQAAGLLLLSKILFGGFKGGGHRGHSSSRWGHGWKQKYKAMTPEERIAFKSKWADKWGCGSSVESDTAVSEKSE